MSSTSPPEHSSPTRSTEYQDLKYNGHLAEDPANKANHIPMYIDAVQEDEPIVNRKELWSYYLYRNGNNSVGVTVFTQTLFQSLATAAGYDPAAGPGSSCLSSTASGQCVVPWMGGTKSVTSVVLLANGICFAILTAICTTLGSAADYGTFGRWCLFAMTVICWASQYACMALTSPDHWKLAMALYMLGCISYVTTMVLYTAVFPRLARNSAHSRRCHEKCKSGQISIEEYDREKSLEHSRISVFVLVHNYIGYTITYLLNLALLLAPKTAHDPKVNNYTIILDNSYWVLLGIWWFIFQSPRPGPRLPQGESYLTIGWKQIWRALKTYKELPNTLLFIAASFFLLDSLVTTSTLVAICQNDRFKFSFLMNTYLGLARAIPSILGPLGFWYAQRYWKIKTKTMFLVTVVGLILIPLWGMAGIWSKKFGLHNAWEFWVYNVVVGLSQPAYFAYSQSVSAEIIPPGFENMFFSFGSLGDFASTMVGPYVVQAIIDRTQDNWQGFPFLFSISVAAALVIWFGVDVEKGKRDAVRWAEMQRVNG